MAVRTQDEINDIAFRALVAALGREDAIRFIRGVAPPKGTEPGSEPALPPFDTDEAHARIMDMHGPSDQAALL